MRLRLLFVVVVALLAALVACGRDEGDQPPAAAPPTGPACDRVAPSQEPLTVGSTDLPEQIVLATVYARCLEAAGYEVNVRANLGPREVVEPALERGEIDLYPEYLNSAILFLSDGAQSATDDPIESAGILRRLFDPRGVVVLQPAPATDQNGFAVTRATARKHKLRTLSDLKPAASQLGFGSGPESEHRPLSLPRLRAVSGLDL